ncbi:ribosomal-protein-alanine N-acetyltransferase [Ruminococcaceae bacterium YRB3002]|nr:ribosomal-protein-alanine N-acetyltransferase [Ruminococcaceae bacterium YRB3002]
MSYELIEQRYGDEVTGIITDRLRMSVLKRSAWRKVTDYVVRNKDFHKQFAQTHEDTYYTAQAQKEYLDYDVREFKRNRLVPLWITLKDDPGTIIGRVSFFNIAYGGMMLAQIGYHLDKDHTGQGYMTEAVKESCQMMFDKVRLHRIEAFVLPENDRSISLIERCGFTYEGTRMSYMSINGKFRDHETFYLLKS